MKRLLAALLCIPLFVLAAEPLTFEGTDSATGQRLLLTIYDTPCENAKARESFVERAQPQLRASVLLWQGKQYVSCYLVVQGLVWSVDETGDPLTPVPLAAFVSRMI